MRRLWNDRLGLPNLISWEFGELLDVTMSTFKKHCKELSEERKSREIMGAGDDERTICSVQGHAV